MKVALCFLISYNHILNKEYIWREWIEPNKDIINIYFHYDEYLKIKSPWIMKHAISPDAVVKTSYYHVVPAYLALMSFAKNHDRENIWFVMLSESCVPIISPNRFRRLFFENYDKSIMSWKKAWWNVDFHKRANLRCIKSEYHLANDPWFVLKREDLTRCIYYKYYNNNLFQIVCSGGLANESIFAIILYFYNQLKDVLNNATHITDWSRMSSATSPHVFKYGNTADLDIIKNSLRDNAYAMFLRKVHPDFPDAILHEFTKKILREDEDAFNKYSNRRSRYDYFINFFFFFAFTGFILFIAFENNFKNKYFF